MFDSFESLNIKIAEGGEISRQSLNAMLVDFSYRTIVNIVDYKLNEILFKGEVGEYQKSELKYVNYLVEVADVFNGEFIIEVVESH